MTNSIIAPFFYTLVAESLVPQSLIRRFQLPLVHGKCWRLKWKAKICRFFSTQSLADFGCDFTGAKHSLRYLRWSWIQNVKNTTPRLGTFGILAADAVCNTLKFIYECLGRLGRLGNEFSHYWWPCGFCCVLVDFLEITKTTSENQNPWRLEPCWTYFSSTYTLTCQT